MPLNEGNLYVDIEVWHIHKNATGKCQMCFINHAIKEKSLWALNGWWESLNKLDYVQKP